MEEMLNTLNSFLFIGFLVAIFIAGGAVGYMIGFLNCSKSYKGLICGRNKQWGKVKWKG
ncbi:hypothetical protein [Clostridium butyricum]